MQASPLPRYLVAAAASALALTAKWWLQPLYGAAPLLVMFTAVVLSAWYGGLGPGLLATAATGIGGHFLLHPAPVAAYEADAATQAARLLLYLFQGTAVSWVAGRLQEAAAASRVREDEARMIHDVGLTVARGLDPDATVQDVTDAATRITGAHFGAFFHNVTNERGDSYMLYKLSGVPADAFARFPMPRSTDVFAPTFRGESVVRSDDIRRDPRYGRNAPHHGMPEGHLPVVSYLAVPVVSRTGEVHGGLFLGHGEAARFDERHERIVQALATQAAIALDNSRLHEATKRAQERAEDARALAEASGRAKDEFLAVLSHELRTPLTPILMWIQMLRRQAGTDAELLRGIDAVERAARAQSRLIEDLLDVSRVIRGQLRLVVETLELSPVIAAATESLRPTADAKGVRVLLVLDDDAGLVAGDAQRLQQVVWNLLANAIKFTPRGGRVQVVLRRVESQVEIEVRDTGQGIAPEFVPHVFERFRQLETGTTRSQGGLGLGLAIVRHLIELHGGTVHCTSPGLGHGATFVVALPLAAVQAPTSRPAAVAPTGEGAAMPSPAQLRGLAVLVVDDDHDTVESLATILAASGAEVRTATNAADALALVTLAPPDVLLSDVGMPGEDGYSLVARIRALPVAAGRIPAVALTAYARPEDRTRALAAGFQMHVAKPVDPAELVMVIATVAAWGGAARQA